MLDDPLTPRPRRRRGFVSYATNATAAMESASVCYAVKLSKAALANIYGPVCHAANMERSAAVNRRQLATTRACLFRTQSMRAGGGTCSQSMQRGPVWHDVNHAATDPCSARRTMQIRPDSRRAGFIDSPYIHPAQCIARAVSGHFKRFSSFPANARQCSARHPRPAARS